MVHPRQPVAIALAGAQKGPALMFKTCQPVTIAIHPIGMFHASWQDAFGPMGGHQAILAVVAKQSLDRARLHRMNLLGCRTTRELCGDQAIFEGDDVVVAEQLPDKGKGRRL